jgi:hypothetical protein
VASLFIAYGYDCSSIISDLPQLQPGCDQAEIYILQPQLGVLCKNSERSQATPYALQPESY